MLNFLCADIVLILRIFNQLFETDIRIIKTLLQS